MEIKVNKSILLKELAIAAKYRQKDEKKSGVPYTYFEATAEGLIVKSMDDQVYYSNVLPLEIVGDEDLETVHEVIAPGVVAINSKVEEVLRKVPGKTVTIKAEKSVVSISADGFSANVATSEVDFKAAPTGTEGAAINSPLSFFKNIVQRFGYAYAIGGPRPVLTGINLKSVDGKLQVIVTDSHRLAYLSEESNIQFGEIIVPAKAFASVLDEFNPDEKLNMVSIGSHVKLIQDERVVYILLLDGKYPDVSRLIQIDPKSIEIKVESKVFLDAIDRALLFAKDGTKNNHSIVQIESVENGLRVFSENDEGKIDSIIPVQSSSENIEVNRAYQGPYLQDAIRAFGQKEVTLLIAPTGYMFIKSDVPGLQLVLPIKINHEN